MKGFCLEVAGKYACFTRPETMAERDSYDVITPSAARGIFECILWKPAISWVIKRIEVLSPIKMVLMKRNEVGEVASEKKACIYIEEARQQRGGRILQDVKYRLFAEFEFIPPHRRSKTSNPVPVNMVDAAEAASFSGADDHPGETEAKYAAMFSRRASIGQCFKYPYLGCREFSATFRLVDPAAEPCTPIRETREFGWMLYDRDYSDPSDIKPKMFWAVMKDGVIDLANVEVKS